MEQSFRKNKFEKVLGSFNSAACKLICITEICILRKKEDRTGVQTGQAGTQPKPTH